MVTKRSKVYVPYLFMLTKCKNVTIYIKNKKNGGAYIIAPKRNLHFKYISQNKVN